MKIHSDNIYYAGTFKDTIDFDPGPDSLKIWMHPNGINDAFVSKLKSASGLLNNPLPDADFSAMDTSPCIGSFNVFTDQSVYASTWDWKFTPATITYLNHTSSSSMQPAVTFNSAGDYMVKLTVTNSSGLDSMVKTAYIKVPVSTIPFISILATDTIICDSELVVFTSDTLNGGSSPSYHWKINQTNVGTSSSLSSHHLKNNDTITCMFTSSARCALPTQVVSKRVVMKVNPVPAVPFINKMNNVLSCDLGGVSYTWYFNNAVINGANSQSYTVTQNGTYNVEVTNPEGCSSISANFSVTNTGIAGVKNESGFTMYPNPSGSVIYLECTREGNDRTFTISDAVGAIVLKGTTNGQRTQVDIAHLAKCLYFVQLEGGNVLKLVKQ